MEVINGTWSLTEVPDEFFDVLKILGYSGLERKYVKRNKLSFTASVKDAILTIKFESKFYSKVKEYKLSFFSILAIC